MRIALVSQEYPPETAHGGIATQTAAKAIGLAALGHEVHVVTRSMDGTRRDREQDGVHVHRLPGSRDWSLLSTDAAQWIAWSTDVAVELAALHRSVDLDLIDVPEYGGEGYVHLVNRPEWSRVLTVVHLHGPLVMLSRTIGWPSPDSELFTVGRHMEGVTVRSADAVISSSACSAQWCEREYGLDAVSVPVLHLGVDTALFRPGDRVEDRPTVVFAGRLATSKGVEDLVSAAAAIARDMPDLRVELVGRGTDEMVARLKAATSDRPDLLRFHGHLPAERLAAVLARGHVFAAPSAYEGGPGLVYLEAMAAGLPVIACSGSGASEVVEEGVTGHLVPPGDVAALTHALLHLLGPAGASFGARGRERVVRQHARDVCVRRIEQHYQELVDRTAVPA